MSIDQAGPGGALNGTESDVTPPVGVGTLDTRYDDLIARLREAAGRLPGWLSTAAEMHEHEGSVATAAVLRVVADVIA